MSGKHEEMYKKRE